jgi:hypothetical protein
MMTRISTTLSLLATTLALLVSSPLATAADGNGTRIKFGSPSAAPQAVPARKIKLAAATPNPRVRPNPLRYKAVQANPLKYGGLDPNRRHARGLVANAGRWGSAAF